MRAISDTLRILEHIEAKSCVRRWADTGIHRLRCESAGCCELVQVAGGLAHSSAGGGLVCTCSEWVGKAVLEAGGAGD